MATLTFEADTHTYRLISGIVERVLPSVSDIIRPLVDLSMVPEAALNYARDRGTAVHKACELDDKNDLDEGALSDELRGYLEGWRKFKREFSPKFEYIEQPMHHEARGYAGTPDRAMKFNALRVVGDIKSVATMSPVTGVQLGGYEALLVAKGFAPHERWGIQLLKDGTYRKTVYPNETATFAGLLNTWNWRQKHGF